jgi:hypothetical protein
MQETKARRHRQPRWMAGSSTDARRSLQTVQVGVLEAADGRSGRGAGLLGATTGRAYERMRERQRESAGT